MNKFGTYQAAIQNQAGLYFKSMTKMHDEIGKKYSLIKKCRHFAAKFYVTSSSQNVVNSSFAKVLFSATLKNGQLALK